MNTGTSAMVLGSGLTPGLEAITTALPGLRDRSLGLAELVDLVGDCQRLINQITAVQAVALASVAATDTDRAEDGTLVERHLGFGAIRLDASALVNGRLGCSDQRAETRIETAVGLVTRMPALLEAVNTGVVDDYRAQLAVQETSLADPETAAAVATRVVQHLGAKLGEVPAGPFRRCVRATLDAIDADAVRQKAERARDGRYLRRYPTDPGVEAWSAILPAEEAAMAWAAINTLADGYRKEGLVETLEQARADALVDLILNRATVNVGINLAVPAGTMTVTPQDGYVPVTGLTAPSNGPTYVPATWLHDLINTGKDAEAAKKPSNPEPSQAAPPAPAAPCADLGRVTRLSRFLFPVITIIECDPGTGTQLTNPTPLGAKTINQPPSTSAYRIPAALARFIDTRDGGCRFPGCAAAARVCDKDHVIPWPRGTTSPEQLINLCRRHHRVKQSTGWNLALSPDGTATWTFPTGEVRTTTGTDHLNTEVHGTREHHPPHDPLEDSTDDSPPTPTAAERAEADQRYADWLAGNLRPHGLAEEHFYALIRDHIREVNTQPTSPEQRQRDRSNGTRHGIVTDRTGLPVNTGPAFDLVHASSMRFTTTFEAPEEPPPF